MPDMDRYRKLVENKIQRAYNETVKLPRVGTPRASEAPTNSMYRGSKKPQQRRS